MTNGNETVKLNALETTIEISFEEISDMIEVDHSKLCEGMDFADRMEYFWNLTND